MYQLSLDQKIANLDELINSKREKVVRLEKEIENLEKKKARLSTNKEISTSSSTSSPNRPEWSTVFGQTI